MKNRFHSLNRDASEIVADLRAMKGLKLAVLGSQNIDADLAAEAIVAHRRAIVDMVGEPIRFVTSDRPVGAEKAARLSAKEFTGSLPVVFHRAEMSYGVRNADVMANMIIANESDALLVVSTGNATSELIRARFEQVGKKVFEIEMR